MFPFLQAENEIGGVFDQHSKICTLHPGNMDIGYLIQFQGQYIYFIFVFISRESPLVFLMKLRLIWRKLRDEEYLGNCNITIKQAA